MKPLVAIHQPNFLPWLGYFDKLARCDCFVLLDHVQFPKTGGNWVNRVRVRVGGEARWITVPVERSQAGVLPIRDVRSNSEVPWRRKLSGTLRASYGKAACFGEVYAWLEPLLESKEPRLAVYNETILREIVRRLGLPGDRLVRSSDLGVEGTGTALLVEIVGATGGRGYLCGGGSEGYLEEARFSEAGLDLVFQDFAPSPYDQGGQSFLPGLSVVDALFHVGVDGVRRLVGS